MHGALRQATVSSWWGLGNQSGFVYYGFYVPHWSYDGGGGPNYWWTLTHKSKKSHAPIDEHLYKVTKKSDYLNYSQCRLGVQQSPIDIPASTWSKRDRCATHV